jgi:hypothetical protein
MKFLFRNYAKLATFFVKAGDKLKFRVVDFATAKDRQLLKNKNARVRLAERADVFVSNVAFHIHLQIFGLVQFDDGLLAFDELFVRFGIVSNPHGEFLVQGKIADFFGRGGFLRTDWVR